MIERSTRPVEIEGGENPPAAAWQLDEMTSSFGPTASRIVGSSPLLPDDHTFPHSQNRNGPSTIGPQKITTPRQEPTILRRRDFGRRALRALSNWEGVVEEVREGTFSGRLIPLSNGAADPGRTEFTEFSFDDLANESDRDLVQPGAVFYWTIGKSRNGAGTLTNVSLVRFRRIPTPTLQRQQRARREAEELLDTLDGFDGEDSPRP